MCGAIQNQICATEDYNRECPQNLNYVHEDGTLCGSCALNYHILFQANFGMAAKTFLPSWLAKHRNKQWQI